MSVPCPFCTISPGRIVLAHDLALVIRDAFPVSSGHTLIIPRRHIGSFFDVTDEEREAMLRLLDAAKEGLDDELHRVGSRQGHGADLRSVPSFVLFAMNIIGSILSKKPECARRIRANGCV